MTWISMGVLWAGYTVLVFGWSQVRGCNAGLFSLVIPGKFTGCNPDAPATSSPSGTSQGYATTPTRNAVPTSPQGPTYNAPGIGSPLGYGTTSPFSPRNNGKPCPTITTIAQAQAILASSKYSTACRQAAADYLYTSALGNG